MQSQKSKWIDQLRTRLRLRNAAWKTEQSYVRTVEWFWDEALKMPSDWSREKKVEHWLSELVRRRDISASTQNARFQALVFFFRHVVKQPLKDVDALRANRKTTFRVAVDRESTLRLLDATPDFGGYPTRFISTLIYACGLRVTEPLNLRIKDVDLAGSRLSLWETKGGKCRVVPVPCALIEPLKTQIDLARAMWKRDVESGLPVALPGALETKYPSRVSAWQWYWVFPQLRPCRHPRTNRMVRYRMHEANVQRAVRVAARKVGLDGLITPHNLRHCYGTHVADSGQNMRSLQVAMGHKSLETTMGYVHSDALSVRSPFDAAPKS